MSSTQLENAGVNPTRPWPADQFERWPIERLTPYANNNPFGSPRREPSWGHGTQKLFECMLRPIVNNSRPGQVIYDPFLGSGTSLIAAEITGRVCYGIELNPLYVDVVVRRWQDCTGRAARHQVSGQSFDERDQRRDPNRSGAAHG
jgi:DNA modification methylase